MRSIAAIALLALAGACAMSGDIANAYDDPHYPTENTAVVAAAPDNIGHIAIIGAGGRPLRCGGWGSPTACQRVRLMPGTTILRLDFTHQAGGRVAIARDMDLPVSVRAGHTYHLVSSVVPDAASPQGGRRVIVQVIDKSADQSQSSGHR